MVNKPLKPCSNAGCNKLSRNRHCDVHKVIDVDNKTERNKHYDKNQRDKVSYSFYRSRQWDVVRRASLSRDNKLCVHCLINKRIKRADVVDHKIPYKVDVSLGLTLSNTQSLCHSCHGTKSAEDKKTYKELSSR